MDETVRSVVFGTTGLWLVLGAAAVIAARAGPVTAGKSAIRKIRIWMFLCTCVQAGHFLEEWQTGFHRKWPALLGLKPWPETFFVVFNVAWLAVWLGSAALIPRGGIVTRTAAWFLALAAVLNAVAHPLLALTAGGYFPGLWTSPLLGVAGYALWRTLQPAKARRFTLRGS